MATKHHSFRKQPMETKTNKQIQKKAEIQKPEKIFWREDLYDFILDLGTMKKAVVVANYLGLGGSYYSISPRSYFPFSDENYDKRFKNPEHCKEYAISILKDWFKSIFV